MRISATPACTAPLYEAISAGQGEPKRLSSESVRIVATTAQQMAGWITWQPQDVPFAITLAAQGAGYRCQRWEPTGNGWYSQFGPQSGASFDALLRHVLHIAEVDPMLA